MKRQSLGKGFPAGDWEPERINLSKHNVSFDEATSVFDDPLFLTFADPEHSLQEQRFIIM
jgi:uncharacterized protein